MYLWICIDHFANIHFKAGFESRYDAECDMQDFIDDKNIVTINSIVAEY